MKIGVEVNGVLRNTLSKIQQEYQKWYLNENLVEMNLLPVDDIERKIISDVTTLDIRKHLEFKDDSELYDFLYKEHTMEIFGHASSTEPNGINYFNDFYLELRDKHEIIIVSDEIGKSKPATLFFLAKFGCLVENVKFYSEITINSMWENVDFLVTANPKLLLQHPENKTLIKFETSYNSEIQVPYKIKSLKELQEKISNIC